MADAGEFGASRSRPEEERRNGVRVRSPSQRVGRPRVVTPEELAEAVSTRRANPDLTWEELARRVGLKRETLRRALRHGRDSTPPAGDGQAIRSQGLGEEAQ